MRIYIPLIPRELLLGSVRARLVHGVTEDLRRAVPSEDQEGHEYIAFLAAVDDSLRMLSKEDVLRRVVVTAEVDASILELPASGEGLLPTAVHLVGDVPWDVVDSIHIDESEAAQILSEAIDGDDTAFDQSVEHDLLWHDVTEREHLASKLAS